MLDLEKIKDLRVAVLGDCMLDQFITGHVDRISPEAPVPVLKQSNISFCLGGAGNVSANLLSLGAQVTLISCVGNDAAGKKLLNLLEKFDNLEAYVNTVHQPTTTKIRFVSQNHHLLRLDQEEVTELSIEAEDSIIKTLNDLAPNIDILIVSDYNKGFITNRIKNAVALLQTTAKKIVDSKGDISEFKNSIDYITPNISELEKLTNMKIKDQKNISEAITVFYNKYHIKNVLVTASEKGMYLYNNSRQGPAYALPSWNIFHEASHTARPVDVSGAGDTVVVALAIGLGQNLSYKEILKFASKCAGIVINKPGTSIVTIADLEYDKRKNDLKDSGFAIQQVKTQKKLGKKIGFINGVFDVFHASHLELLKQAKQQCDFLFVALNSDSATKKLKGDSRPIVSEENRAKIVRSCSYVDAVLIFDDEDPRFLIKEIQPDFIFKGVEYKNKSMIEQPEIDQVGSQLIFLETDSITTTSLIEKIKNQC